LVPPHIPVPERRRLVRARRLEPGVLGRCMVHHQVGDDPEAAVASGPEEFDEVPQRSIARVHRIIVDDVIAIVAVGGGIERHQPDTGDAEPGEIVDILRQPAEIPDTIAIAVAKGLDVQAIEHGIGPPHVAGLRDIHPYFPLSCGSTLPPKVSMKACCSWPTWWR